jgi:YidC/Oxa1 family membrane protein insertase
MLRASVVSRRLVQVATGKYSQFVVGNYAGATFHIRPNFIIGARLMSTEKVDSANPFEISTLTPEVFVPDAGSASDGLCNALDSITAAASSGAADVVALEQTNIAIRGVMEAIESVHNFIGVPYWEAIIISTIALRVLLLPIVIKTAQGSARLAKVRPLLHNLTEAMNKDPNTATDQNVRMRYQKEMQNLFLKHKVNPIQVMMWPMFQFPIFIACFMGLRDMGTYFPGFATGGAFWFTDLSAADPFYIFPLLNSMSFLAMIELGSDGVQMEQKQAETFKMVMRGLAVIMVPLTLSMNQGLFVYWCTNNSLSIIQGLALKNPKVKKFLNIPEIPKEGPDLKVVNPIVRAQQVWSDRMKQIDQAKAEILDGSVPSKTSPPTKLKNLATPPPVTFSAPPKKKSS